MCICAEIYGSVSASEQETEEDGEDQKFLPLALMFSDPAYSNMPYSPPPPSSVEIVVVFVCHSASELQREREPDLGPTFLSRPLCLWSGRAGGSPSSSSTPRRNPATLRCLTEREREKENESIF